ncbi:FAD-dependent oxidoreductase [Pigmentibacter sp. JX0631]|uniref:FAD-dependent oxidoreductase n=1 Tax=Pigmentibacter sp. JX0631 TaxID=2976982 RepID=UPI0024692987|nr:FAD-dependent oxidoreductase [Pigmentibacter sp. JX0631]WGL61009.1 FAD-dependent oxidoreductase [Pigmentibacter sp. JX0631]
MTQYIIIGSGILGLSVAEYLTRNLISPKEIKIISNENEKSGSYAAAANLATKGQLFARDPHFRLKLESKVIYKNWLQSLIKELNASEFQVNKIYNEGKGIDYFSNSFEMFEHYKRVKQTDVELNKRNLPLTSIQAKNNTIIYENEAWVDGKKLLLLLRNVLEKRSVNIEKNDFNLSYYKDIIRKSHCKNIIFCVGAWTKPLLNELQFELPLELAKERLTIGSTFEGEKLFHLNEYSLVEKVSLVTKDKITLSGNSFINYISSSTAKINNLNDIGNNDRLYEKNIKFLNFLQNLFIDFPHNISNIKLLKQIDGYRVGFGHSEIVLTELVSKNDNIKKFICAGAHKSGFLFAPVIGERMQKMLFEK